MLLDPIGEGRPCRRRDALILQVAQPAERAVPPHVGAVEVGLRPILRDHLARVVGDPRAIVGA
eukprot:699989-Pyramimonas_sp.AAC.1